MKKILQLLLIACLAVITSGCASPCMANRGHDSADIFTATVGVGGGAKARIGPIQAGLIVNLDKAGLRNGELFVHERESYSRRGNPGEINLLILGGDTSNTSETIRRRNKAFNTLNLIFPVAIVEPETSQLTPHYFTTQLVERSVDTIKRFPERWPLREDGTSTIPHTSVPIPRCLLVSQRAHLDHLYFPLQA